MEKGIAKILVFGDVVGKSGTEELTRRLWDIRKEYSADMVIVNGENAAEGNGLDRDTAELLFRSGADVITSGNHIFKKSSIYSFLDDSEYVIRPANYPAECPGSGSCIFDLCGYKVLVMNLLGNVYMESLDSPFRTADRILSRYEGKYDLAVVDFHAEATSEKYALARYLDGRVSVIFGTHTHVQTADAQVLSGGTGYITDVGMCGPTDSILGIRNDIILKKFLTSMPVKHEEAPGPVHLSATLFSVAPSTQKCLSAVAVRL